MPPSRSARRDEPSETRWEPSRLVVLPPPAQAAGVGLHERVQSVLERSAAAAQSGLRLHVHPGEPRPGITDAPHGRGGRRSRREADGWQIANRGIRDPVHRPCRRSSASLRPSHETAVCIRSRGSADDARGSRLHRLVPFRLSLRRAAPAGAACRPARPGHQRGTVRVRPHRGRDRFESPPARGSALPSQDARIRHAGSRRTARAGDWRRSNAPLGDCMSSALGRAPRVTVIAAVQPLITGAAHFNTAMVAALRKRAAVDVISWRRMYPPLLYRGPVRDEQVERQTEGAAFVLDWHDPRTWREAARRVSAYEPDLLVIPWLHPIATTQCRWLLRKAPRRTRSVVVCHNVTPHEPFHGSALLTRTALRHADCLVTHSRRQRSELAALGLGCVPTVDAFHPRFVASDLAAPPKKAAIAAERRRHGNPELLLLCFGAIRPYKGVDLALEALALVDPTLSVRLVVAGRFWSSESPYRRLVEQLDLGDRVELRGGYVPDDEAAVLFGAADGVLLPYRTASQSGVIQ